jgi:hypothetical protein
MAGSVGSGLVAATGNSVGVDGKAAGDAVAPAASVVAVAPAIAAGVTGAPVDAVPPVQALVNSAIAITRLHRAKQVYFIRISFFRSRIRHEEC